MTLNILAIGDIVGEAAIDFLSSILPALKEEENLHFVVANGENASGLGITPTQAKLIFSAGVDVITLGNHTWNRIQISNFLDDRPDIIRPANYPVNVPGEGITIWNSPHGVSVGVINLLGRQYLNANLDSPFKVATQLIKDNHCDIYLIDFHAEATSEKGALAWYLDGQISALWGTHTHVPTADTQVLPKGTGFVTDLGMTGPLHSVLGVPPAQSINLFQGGLPQKFQTAGGVQKLGACLFSIDTETKKCLKVKRIEQMDSSTPY